MPDTKTIEIQGVGRFQVPASYTDDQVRDHIQNLRRTKPEIFGESAPTFGSRLAEVTTGTPHPLDQAASEINQLRQQPLRTLADTAKQVAMMPVNVANAVVTSPLRTLKTLSGGNQFGEDISAGRYGAAAGDMVGGIANFFGPEAVASAPETASRTLTRIDRGLQRGVQEASGVGPGRVAAAEAEHAAQADATHAQFQTQVADTQTQQQRSLVAARAQHQAELANVDTTRTLVSRGHQLARDAHGISEEVSAVLPKLRDSARQQARAMYPKIEGTLEPGDVRADIHSALDAKLRGSDKVPAPLARILDETMAQGSTSPTIMGRALDLNKPADAAAYRQLKAQGVFTPEEVASIEGQSGEPVTFDKLHGYYSELGRSLTRDLPGDEAAAIIATREKLAARMKDMASIEGKADAFGAAQKNWSVLENTFYNDRSTGRGGSPLARALATRDPVTGKLRVDFVQAIMSDPKQFQVADELLSRYPEAAGLRARLQSFRQKFDEARSLPKTAPQDPSVAKLPAIPTLPSAPSTDPFDRAAFIQRGVEKRSQSLKTFHPHDAAIAAGAALYGRPEGLLYYPTHAAGGYFLGSEPVVEWAGREPRRIGPSVKAPTIPSPLPVVEERKRTLKRR